MGDRQILKRKMDLSENKRLFSVVVIKENEGLTKTVVPSHWVDEKQLIVYYPPKGHKVLAKYIAEWAAPQVGWRKFVYVEHILKAATQDICNQMLSFSTEEESESSDVDKGNNFRECSPTLELMEPDSDKEAIPSNTGLRRSPRKLQSGIPEVSSKKKALPNPRIRSADIDFEMVTEEAGPSNTAVRSPRRSPRRANSQSTPPAVGSSLIDMCDTKMSEKLEASIRKTGDGGSSFREMSTKQFQYALLMKLESNFQSIQSTQQRILERLDVLENGRASTAHEEVKVTVTTMEEFNDMERLLSTSRPARNGKITQIRNIGGPNPRRRLKNIIDELLSRDLQTKFSKDGLKGKRRFAGTMIYKCIKEALSTGDGQNDKIDHLIGDLLKRAVVNIHP